MRWNCRVYLFQIIFRKYKPILLYHPKNLLFQSPSAIRCRGASALVKVTYHAVTEQFPFLPGVPAICNGQENSGSCFVHHYFYSLKLLFTICLIFLESKRSCEQSKSKWYLDTLPAFYWKCYKGSFLWMIEEKSKYLNPHLQCLQ